MPSTKRKQLQPKDTLPSKAVIQNRKRNKKKNDEQKLKQYLTTKPLQILKGILHT
jgi:hypothetical protein